MITGFGSVYVNGTKFETDASTFIVDGDGSGTQADLKLGMVVKLKVETEDGVYTGKAIEVVYDDEVQGPIAPIPGIVTGVDPTLKTFVVFGQTITIDETGTVFDGTSFTSIAADDVVEVSGFRVSATEIKATYLEKTGVLVPGASEVELRGVVDQYTGGSTFEINNTVINIDLMATEIDVPGGVLSDGLYVEVEGIIQADQSVNADRIEAEDEEFEDDVDDISLQGVVSGFSDIDSDFFIGSQRVNASGAQLSPAGLVLDDGLNVEVEGEIAGGTLIADKVEARDGDAELRSTIGAVDVANNWFEVTYPTVVPGVVVVRTDDQTLFEDETGAVSSEAFSISDLTANVDFVRVEGREVNGEVVASIVKRVDGSDPDLRLEGAVDGHEDDVSITILGIQYAIDPAPGGTSFEGFPDSSAFFLALEDGDFVEIDDDFPADGVADEVEFDD